jgi:hypothetical protein
MKSVAVLINNILGVSLLLFSSAALAEQSVDTALSCLNNMKTAHPARSPRYIDESETSKFLFVQNGDPNGIGFYHLTPGKSEFCSLNFPRKSGFIFEYQGRSLKYLTSDGQGPAENKLPKVTLLDCKSNADVSASAIYAASRQIQAMAFRVGSSGNYGQDRSKAHKAVGKECLAFDGVYHQIDEGMKEIVGKPEPTKSQINQ